MDFIDAVLARRSVRLFLPDPVPRETLTKLVDTARWAPSWGNTQPWEVVIADGEKTKTLAEAFVAEAGSGASPRPDIAMPAEFEPPHKDRYFGLGRALFAAMGITREDTAARTEHYLNMYRFFGAPVAVYLGIDGRLNEPYSCLDIGSFGTLLCGAAVQEGLGTIFLAASMHYPDIVKRVLGVGDDKKVVIGIALGKPHPSAPASVFRSDRLPVDSILRFA